MIVVPINEAEVILDPFFDGSASDLPLDKRSLLEEFSITMSDGTSGKVEQTWCSINLSFEKKQTGQEICLSRTCDLDLHDYDVFRLFASFPSWVECRAELEVDGETQVPFVVRGTDTMDEHEGQIRGSRLTGYSLAFRLLEPRMANLTCLWTGLANRKRQVAMEARLSPFTSEWPGMLNKDAGDDLFAPRIGILFGAAELETLRKTVRHPSLLPIYEAFKASLAEALTWEPEQDIGRFIPFPDDRWVRVRDRAKKQTAGTMDALAFVGLIERDAEYLHMAVRMALSAAHYETWTESFMGCLPGATWHHRSFAEEAYCQSCALVLDWAGNILTPHARQIIEDAIAMKGLPRIESDFKRMEYIRSMNQGIAFSLGRIFGALALAHHYPRYIGLVDEAERDLHEMIDAYVQPDGGTLEGPGYWIYTFTMVMPMLLALSRRRGESLEEYATDTLRKTAAYGLGMLSTTGDGGVVLGINDCGLDTHYPAQLASSFARLTGEARWQTLAQISMASEMNAAESSTFHPDIYQFIFADCRKPGDGETLLPLADRFDAFPDTGQVSTQREGIHFHLTSGPTLITHYHEDKGSFILEAEGESLICDRGSTHYSHPETLILKYASLHNILYPEAPDGRLIGQPGAADGAALTCGQQNKVFWAVSDNRDAWEKGLFEKNRRRIFSPLPNLFFVDDEIILAESMSMSFRLNTPLPPAAIEMQEGRTVVRGKLFSLHVVPLNWNPSEITAREEGIDSRHQPVTLIRLLCPPAKAHRLLTALVILPVDEDFPVDAVKTGPTPSCRIDKNTCTANLADDRLEIIASMAGEHTTFCCNGVEWNEKA